MENEVRDELPLTSPADRPLTEVRWGVSTAFVITGLMIGLTLFGGASARRASELLLATGSSDNTAALVMGALLIGAYVVLILAVWGVGRAAGVGLADSVGLRSVPVGLALGLAAVITVVARLFSTFWGLVLVWLGIDLPARTVDPTRLLPTGGVGIVFTVLIVCVLAPIAEEMVFRGVLLSALKDRWGERPSIIVSSAIFAAVHILPFSIPPIFVLALMLGRSFVRSKSLWVPILGHALFNAVGIGALYALKATEVL